MSQNASQNHTLRHNLEYCTYNTAASYSTSFFSLPAWPAYRFDICVNLIASKDIVWTHSPEPWNVVVNETSVSICAAISL